MKYQSTKNQKGMTFWGTIVVLAAVILIGMVGMKTLPAYMEFNSVKAAIKKIAQNTSGELNKKDVADAFSRQSSIDNIESIKGSDLSVQGRTITASYQKVIPLFGNMSILLDFNADSNQ